MFVKTLTVTSLKVFGAILSFALAAVITNTGTMTEAGVILFSLTCMQFIGLMNTGGIANYTLKNVERCANTYFLKRFSIFVFSHGLLLLATLFLIHLIFETPLKKAPPEIVSLTGIGILLFSLNLFYAQINVVRGSPLKAAFFQNVFFQLISFLCFFSILYAGTFSPSIVLTGLAIIVFSLLLSTVVNALQLRRASAPRENNGESTALPKGLYLLMISNYFQVFTTWGGNFIVSFIVTIEDFSVFNTCFRASFIVSFILVSVNSIVAPKLAWEFKHGRQDKFVNTYLGSVTFLTLITIPLVGMTFLFSSEILSIFGDSYQSHKKVLNVLVLGHLVNALTGPVTIIMAILGYERQLLKLTAASALISVATTALLTYQYGILGAAFAAVIPLIVQNVGSVVFLAKNQFGKILFEPKAEKPV